MRRLIGSILGMLALAVVAVSIAGAHWKTRAFQLYHGGRYHTRASLQAPPSVAQDARQLERDWLELRRLQPGLNQSGSNPMASSTDLLFGFARKALKDGDRVQFAKVSRLLNEIWLQRRNASQLDLEALQNLQSWQQSLQSFYANCALQGGEAELPVIDPRAWPGRISLAHRLLVNYRVKGWEEWEGSAGVRTWLQACDCLERLDHWHQQLDSGQELSPPTPELEPLYEALLSLQKGP